MENGNIGFEVTYSDKDVNLAEKFMMLGRWLQFMRKYTDHRIKKITIHPDSYTITVVAEGAIGGDKVADWDIKQTRW